MGFGSQWYCLLCRVDELKILTEEELVDMAIKEAFKVLILIHRVFFVI